MSSHVPIDRDLARLIIERALDFAIITTDATGTITSWNPGAEKAMGWSAADAIGRNVAMIFAAEDRDAGLPEDEMRRAGRDGRAVDERHHVRADGSRFWASGLLMPLHDDAAGDAQAYVKMMWDRTVERSADRRYHAMTAALPGFVFVTDTDGNNVETNELFQAYTGRGEAELNGDRWLEVLHPDDHPRAAETWAQAVATGDTYEARYRFRRHDGEYRCFACRGVPERDEAGRIVRWMGTCIDVENEARAHAALERLNISLEHKATASKADLATAIEDLQAEIAERTRTEEALRQAQKVEAIGQLTGGVAHDFDNLLTIISSSVDLLDRPGVSEEKRGRYIAAIRGTADRAAALTSQLLAFARRQPLQPETFDAFERAEQLLPLLQTTVGSHVEIAIEHGVDGCVVEADPTQFDTAVLNMVVNARDAMKGAGSITMRVGAEASIPQRRGHGEGAGEFVAVSITDTGSGIAPDRLARIFEPFFTTKEVGKGTGLGLSQVFGFAKQSGGDVTVDSEEGQGATFTLYLPRATAKPTDTEPHIPEPPVEHAGDSCILVVEDNQTVGEFAAQLLEELGHSTMWAASAQAALDLIAEKPDRFDAVFSDVVMPGIDGVEFARRLREQYPSLPIVLTSGYSHVLAAEGAHGFPLLRKPYSVEQLSRVLRNAVTGQAARRHKG